MTPKEFYSSKWPTYSVSADGWSRGVQTPIILRIVTPDGFLVNESAADSFLRMQRDSGYIIRLNRAYDSFANQQALYDAYVAAKAAGKQAVLAAKPGYSDHQMGMAIDVRRDNGGRAFVLQHGHKYGWSHPVKGEPWHAVYSANG